MSTIDQKPTTVSPAIPEALTDPISNRGSGFTTAERKSLGLTGRLPAGVLSLQQQADRVWRQLGELGSDLQRNLLLEQIHDRNETLYYKVLTDHLPQLLPIVYDPTVGEAIEKYSDEYRGQRGVYLSIDAADEIEEAFATLGLGPEDVDLIVCSDAEEILGIGDWGVGGIQISIGKLAIYTAGAGIHPNRAIAVSLDVGTDNPALLNDPLYLGNRHSRHRGADYDAFIKSYIETATRLFPNALLHFEDFGPEHARDILATYSDDYRIFNDDVQGTGAVVMAALYAGVKTTGIPMREQTLVVFGSGTAGVGIADQLRDAMIADGATRDAAIAQIWLVDKQGLLFDDMDDLRNFQTLYAKPRSAVPGSAGTVTLVDAIRAVKPTVLLGTSTAHGAFTEDVITAMADSTPRPIILPISNPTEKIEADPKDVITWTKGAALVATGIPVDPFTFEGATFHIGQANNFLVFPGIGLGVIVSGARHVTPGILAAAAKAVAARTDATAPGASLLPDVSNLREISAIVAHAVYDQAVAEGLATITPDDVVEAIQDAMWAPEYTALS
ncbi:NAD-dependent malic enzyme [Rathayibacter sp. AY1F3]|uniref:NAD-dependent malic enzyme n=1 Tax=Rathayibacter sp. AY1F3 TaxID=2080558 RepID=UPI000CE740B7|nr:NAD-dependent malic enzyme [Rathayibacter sp. AY1F3]PPG92852.1 NAD-dependent malic enzyme [Rathayibacter sp. AY1F3]